MNALTFLYMNWFQTIFLTEKILSKLRAGQPEDVAVELSAESPVTELAADKTDGGESHVKSELI